MHAPRSPVDDPGDPGRWLPRAMTLWSVLAVAASLKAFLRPGCHSVYGYFPEAARHWWAGLDLYACYPNYDPYRYSPTFAVAATPFGLLPDTWGGAIWILGSVAALVWALRSWARVMLPGGWSMGREAAFLGLALPASIGGIWSSQANALIVALVLSGLLAVRREHWWTAAWCLAAPVFIKIWPIVVVAMLATRWPRQLAGRFTAACVVLAGVPFLTQPWPLVCRQYAAWYAALTGPLQARWGGYRDAWTIWEHLAPPVSFQGYRLLQVATLAALLGWCAWQSRRIRSTDTFLVAVLAGWSAWQLLLGPGTERLTYGLIAPAQAWAVVASVRARRLRAWSMVALVTTAIFSFGDFEMLASRLLPHAEVLLPFGILAFVAWLAAWPWTGVGTASPAAIDGVEVVPMLPHVSPA